MNIRSRWVRRRFTLCMIWLAVCLALSTAGVSQARGVFWLPTETVTDASFDHLNPVLASFHNHGYALSVRVHGDSPVTSVIFSTNESGHWNSSVVSDQGPANTYSGQFASLAVDPSNGRLYATWAYARSPEVDAVGVWTRDPGGSWSGPTDVFVGGSIGGQPSIAVHNGTAYVGFIASTNAGTCANADPPGYRSGDVQVAAYDGTAWSAAQNLTSCIPDTSVHNFDNVKLAVDESGRFSLVSSAEGDLWYQENAGGTWSAPAQITTGAMVPSSDGTSLRTYYGIAASAGNVSVAYVQRSGVHTYDVKLLTHQVGAGWSAPLAVSPPDASGCPKFGVAIVAAGVQVALAYLRGHTGYCATSSGVAGNVPSLYVGSPGHLAAVGSLLGPDPDCFSSALAIEMGLLRFMVSCDRPASVDRGQLYYAAQFLDSVGPVSRLVAPAVAATSGIPLHWSAQDPQPGSGVAYYQLAARDGSGQWHTLLANTQARQLLYHAVHAGHRYTFRVRARDRADNWGAWSVAHVQVH